MASCDINALKAAAVANRFDRLTPVQAGALELQFWYAATGSTQTIAQINADACASGFSCIVGRAALAAKLQLLCNASNPPIPPSPPCTLPTAPVDLGVSAGNSQNTLNWPAGVGATGYNIKRSLASGGPYTIIGTSAASPYIDLTAVNGTEYFYVASSTNACGESAGNSIESHGTPLGPAVTDFFHSPVPNHFEFTWVVANPANWYLMNAGDPLIAHAVETITGIGRAFLAGQPPGSYVMAGSNDGVTLWNQLSSVVTVT